MTLSQLKTKLSAASLAASTYLFVSASAYAQESATTFEGIFTNASTQIVAGGKLFVVLMAVGGLVLAGLGLMRFTKAMNQPGGQVTAGQAAAMIIVGGLMFGIGGFSALTSSSLGLEGSSVSGAKIDF
ncbi:hypothetical protein ACQU0X_26555 [Pseudovibrio ascidiaceicola]|uniref:hypothetical protein n=1 Tax=Pseudovibrio ascidiaceicola TaxID=285279 RepID=UPI003D35E6F0